MTGGGEYCQAVVYINYGSNHKLILQERIKRWGKGGGVGTRIMKSERAPVEAILLPQLFTGLVGG